SDCPLDVIVVDLLKSLDQMKLVTVLMTSRVEPCPVVQANGVHDERVSFPFSDGIAEPCGVHVFWMTAPVRVDDAKRVLVLETDGRYGGGLNDLKRHDAG